MADKSYEIHPYSIDNLISILAEKSRACPETVKVKLHRVYFDGYFGTLQARTIIVENDYVDRDYLDDYLGYYGSCFTEYDRKCARLHFFSNVINEGEFATFLSGESAGLVDRLSSSYLGFIVVKPLPQTFIGRTCLKTYDDDGHRRHFPVIRNYESNLYGMRLHVCSLAFQEQDHVVSACATSSLWSIFHGTGILFQHPILSPVEITKIACESTPLESRFIPNEGLYINQMAQAVRKLDLEPLTVRASDEEAFKTNLYAYINCGIPLLLGIILVDMSRNPGSQLALHAVTITGYSLGHPRPQASRTSGLLLRSSQIDKVYVHDDQVGPFSRIISDFQDIRFNSGAGLQVRKSMGTSHRGENSRIGSIRAVPEFLLIPLYHKIRIQFSFIRKIVEHFDLVLEELKRIGIFHFPERDRLLWDVHLTTVNDFKSEILKTDTLQGDLKHRVLSQSLPRFLWRAKAYCRTKSIFDFIFDATDIEQASFLQSAIVYDDGLAREMVSFARGVDSTFKNTPAWKIMEWFEKADRIML